MTAISKHILCAQTLLDPTHVTAKLVIDLMDVLVQVPCTMLNTEARNLHLYFHQSHTLFIDIDECMVDNVCDHSCTNTEGSFVCDCRSGFSKTLNEIGCLGKINL